MNIDNLSVDEYLNKMKSNRNFVLKLIDKLDMDYELNIERLKEYEYIEDLKGLQHGSIVRYINVEHRDKNNNHKLSNCFIFSDFEFSQAGTCIILKTFRHSVFKINVDKLFIFQKYSKDEMMLKALCSLIQQDDEDTSGDETCDESASDTSDDTT
jgi:hypothetical protein